MSLRLLKVIVQPIFVEDDGENLTERITEPQAIPAAEWPQFVERFEETIQNVQNEFVRKGE